MGETNVDTKTMLKMASTYVESLEGHVFDVLSIAKPVSPEAAANLAKVVSKLSPVLANLIEFNLVELLNSQDEFRAYGKWRRQDPGFPDAVFEGSVLPMAGLEIKAWFPLATEITARFKDSQTHFSQDNINVAMLAWLPEYLIFGKPRILGVCVLSALSIAQARDTHYHNPPDYIVVEPEDTTARTRNLQQTNTNGYKWQDTQANFEEAKRLVAEWGQEGSMYQTTSEHRARMRTLLSRYKYRSDTNYAKMDRIRHPDLEAFKKQVYSTVYCGLTVAQWNAILSHARDAEKTSALKTHLDITSVDPETLVE